MSEANPTPAQEPVCANCQHLASDHYDYRKPCFRCEEEGTRSSCTDTLDMIYAAALAAAQRERDSYHLRLNETGDKLIESRERIAELEREVRSAADIAIEEHEASICPEDFGCAEYTTSLSRQIEQQQRDIAAEREAIAREIRCETCNCAAANGKCEWCQFADKIEQGGFAPQNIRDSRIANAQKGDGE